LYCATNNTFVEQFHGASWDLRGRYVAGPAPRGLTTLALRIRRGRAEVAPSRSSPGPPRGVPGRAGVGTACTGDVIFEEGPGFARTDHRAQGTTRDRSTGQTVVVPFRSTSPGHSDRMPSITLMTSSVTS
jgi:hypothetical protein